MRRTFPARASGATRSVSGTSIVSRRFGRVGRGSKHRALRRRLGAESLTRCSGNATWTFLELSSAVESGAVRSRARLGMHDPTSRDLARVTRAYTAFVVCAGGARDDGDVTGLRQATWTTRGGMMVTEIRSEKANLSSSRVAQIVEPLVGGYAAGALDAARVLGRTSGSAGAGMTVDVTKTLTPNGETVLRVVMQGATEAAYEGRVPTLRANASRGQARDAERTRAPA